MHGTKRTREQIAAQEVSQGVTHVESRDQQHDRADGDKAEILPKSDPDRAEAQKTEQKGQQNGFGHLIDRADLKAVHQGKHKTNQRRGKTVSPRAAEKDGEAACRQDRADRYPKRGVGGGALGLADHAVNLLERRLLCADAARDLVEFFKAVQIFARRVHAAKLRGIRSVWHANRTDDQQRNGKDFNVCRAVCEADALERVLDAMDLTAVAEHMLADVKSQAEYAVGTRWTVLLRGSILLVQREGLFKKIHGFSFAPWRNFMEYVYNCIVA